MEYAERLSELYGGVHDLKIVTVIPTFRRTAKIERWNTGESINYDVTNRNIVLLQWDFHSDDLWT